MAWPGWEDFDGKGAPPAAPATKKRKFDRGRAQGAKWCYVRPDCLIVDYELAKKHGSIPKDWIRFQSQKEAKRFVYLKGEQEFGNIRNLRAQVDCPLYAVRPDGLKEKICNFRIDFLYERPVKKHISGFAARPGREGGIPGWEEVYEDVKGFRQDVYKLKKKWFESQYGCELEET